MSLINEALKKAQRLRTEDQADDAAPVPGGSVRVAKRKQARSANTLVLIASAALVLVVVSVVVTVWLLNRPSSRPTQVAAAPANHQAPVTVENAATPSIVPPGITPPVGAAGTPIAPATAGGSAASSTTPDASASGETAAPVGSPTAAPNSVAQSQSTPADSPATAPAGARASVELPAAKAGAQPATTAPAAPIETAPAAPAHAPPLLPPQPDERISAFVDSIRVTGIRSSGNESRVLMNDRVYRVNDIVERTLGVRLVKVTTDSLTFSDAKGATYVKYF